MAFDGIVIANLVKEFSDALTGGKIAKITQTERDELLYHKELPGDETTSSLGQRKSSAGISDGYQQAGTDDCPEFLHAASQAHRKRTHRVGQPAGSGTLYSF